MRALIAILMLYPGIVAAEQFDAGCKLPFAAIQEEHPIDKACGIEGDADQAPHQAQNRAKNDFCETATPVEATKVTLKNLQTAVDNAQPHIAHGCRYSRRPT